MKKVERYFYPAVFTYEPGQEIAVVFPDLDAATSGVDDNDALLSARELLGCVMFGLEEDGEEIPVPTPLSKINLQENERAVLVDVYMPSIPAGEGKSFCKPYGYPSCLAECRRPGKKHQFFPGSAGRSQAAAPFQLICNEKKHRFCPVLFSCLQAIVGRGCSAGWSRAWLRF